MNAAAVAASSTEKIPIAVSIAPQAYLAERIGGDPVAVIQLVQTGQDPHYFEPMPRQMAGLNRTRLYFHLNLPFEAPLVQKLSKMFPTLGFVDQTRGIPLRSLTTLEQTSEKEPPGTKKHSEHQGRFFSESESDAHRDPHVWTSPKNFLLMAGSTTDALIRLDPRNKTFYEARYQSLKIELAALDRELDIVLAPMKGRAFYVFHPAFGYLADAFGLRQIPIEETGKEPTAQQLARIIQKARKDGVQIVFVQPQFSKKSAALLAKAIGGRVISIDPLAKDYASNLRQMAAVLREGLVETH